MLLAGFTPLRLLVPRDLRLSQVPSEPHCAFALLSDSGRALVPSLHGTLVLPPDNWDEEGLRHIAAFGALSHGLSTSCLRFVPPSLATTQNSLPGGGQSFPGGIAIHPLSSVGKFRPYGFPFPWALLGATQSQLFSPRLVRLTPVSPGLRRSWSSTRNSPSSSPERNALASSRSVQYLNRKAIL